MASRQSAKKERHCKCRKTTTFGFMIQCEKCEIWFHGDCIGMSKKEGDLLDNYFCESCIKKSNGQCANPSCVEESRSQSKYCSDKCGQEYNRIRYERYFLPKWNQYKYSVAKTNRLSEINQVEKEIEETHTTIGRLRKERDELETKIAAIKTEASRLRAANVTTREKSVDEDQEMEQERAIEQSKTFCITCGCEQTSEKTFKHWYQCHKKQESQYNFTSDEKWNSRLQSKYDDQPKLYCETVCEKKGKVYRYCMHIASACPQHSNWQPSKDEVCGCPTNVMQELELNDDYCLELKSECNQHYNWDKFRLAMKDMERIQAFNRLSDLRHRSSQLTINLRDTHGGVVGILLHDTKDYRREHI